MLIEYVNKKNLKKKVVINIRKSAPHEFAEFDHL